MALYMGKYRDITLLTGLFGPLYSSKDLLRVDRVNFEIHTTTNCSTFGGYSTLGLKDLKSVFFGQITDVSFGGVVEEFL